ncbi:MAG TPA: FAD:protein FMN transferase [Kofleriaceae bacterium]|nr:FAD:protein FMN transferase [Kofleriaceae bacterium]
MRRALAIAVAVGLATAGAAAVAHAQPKPQAPAEAQPQPAKLVHTTTAMGTSVMVTIWSDDEAAAAKATDAAFDEIRRLDRMMTTWLPDSEISRINASAGLGDKAAVPVSDETMAVIERALDVSRQSNGLFDITVGAFSGLWKFDQDMDYTLPDQAEVKERVKLVNWRDVLVDKKHKTIRLRRKGMKITLGGIAKGYAVDRMAAILEKAGFSDFIVQAGGDMYVSGTKAGAPWVVGIRDPRGPRDDSFAVAPVRDHSFSTSGDYERGFVKDGIRYHHILDPRDGEPARKTRSVTIMAKDAFTADAYSKVLFILGPTDGLAFAAKLPDFQAVFVDGDNHVTMSPGLEGVVKILHPPTPGI